MSPEPRRGPPTGEQATLEAAAVGLQGSFPGDLGIEMVEIGDDLARGRMPVDQRHLHPGGYVHGGAWVAFADTVAAWGTMRHLADGQDFTTVELKANVFTSARSGEELEAVARPMHVGRRTQVWQVEIEKGGRRAALFVCTQMILG